MRDDDHFFDDEENLDDLPHEHPAEPEQPEEKPPPPPEKTRAELVAEFEKEFFPRILLIACKAEPLLSVETLIAAREKFFEDAGSPTDPVERSLLGAVFAMQFRSSLTLAYAADLGPKDHAALMSISIRLNAEVRRTALALKTLRSRPSRNGATAANGATKKPKAEDVAGGNFAETRTRAYKAVPQRGREAQPQQTPRPHRSRKAASA